MNLGDHFVHIGRIGFLGAILDIQNTHSHHATAEANLDHVTGLDIVRRLGNLAVHEHVGSITRFIRYRAPLDDTRDLQVLIKPHKISRLRDP